MKKKKRYPKLEKVRTGKKQNENVYLYLFVFLFILTMAFVVTMWQNRLDDTQRNRMESNKTETLQNDKKQLDKSTEQENTDFVNKNINQIQKLTNIQNQLLESIPTLSVTGKEFNDGVEELVALLIGVEEKDLQNNWQEFQQKIAFQYEKIKKIHEKKTDLPKQVVESQDKIMGIIQELNQVIQEMNN